MKTLFIPSLLGFAALALGAPPSVSNAAFENQPYSGNLARQIASVKPAWFAYSIETPQKKDTLQKNQDNSCCWSDGRQGCALESEGVRIQQTASRPAPVPLEGDSHLVLLFRVENNHLDKIRMFSAACPLDAGGLPFVWIDDVPAQASLAYLSPLVTGPDDNLSDAALAAVAQHAVPAAAELLSQWSSPDHPARLRERVSFWLGASRGEQGAIALKKMLANDPDDHVREKVIFALSINKSPQALDTIIDAAHHDHSPGVRSQALFWLSQKAGARAAAAIQNAIENDPDTAVKRKAVFALSQLPKDEGVPKLISVAETQRNPEIRKQAFFWLGQSNDPRALAFIQKVLTQ